MRSVLKLFLILFLAGCSTQKVENDKVLVNTSEIFITENEGIVSVTYPKKQCEEGDVKKVHVAFSVPQYQPQQSNLIIRALDVVLSTIGTWKLLEK